MTSGTGLAVYDGIQVIDVDTHLTERHDLWTSRAPRGYEDRLPRVREIGGQPMWVLDGSIELGRAGPSSVIRPDGSKALGAEFRQWRFDDTHPAAWDPKSRLEIMDRLGVHAQIVYPNMVAGFGAQKLSATADPTLRLLCVTLFNDAMAEFQHASGQRLFPMALLPWWDIDAAAAEAERIHEMGLRGVNTNADPQDQGYPDLGTDHWDPLWDVCSDLALPVNFHVGASETQHSWFGKAPWPSLGDDAKLLLGSSMIMLSNARVVSNIIISGVLERFPKLKVVSVESGIGWIPFVLESLEYQATQAPKAMEKLSLSPTEYFRRQIYSCFWFEQQHLASTIEAIGADNAMFETDFPHPTCLYPDSLAIAAPALAELPVETRRKVLSENAAKLYNIPLG